MLFFRFYPVSPYLTTQPPTLKMTKLTFEVIYPICISCRFSVISCSNLTDRFHKERFQQKWEASNDLAFCQKSIIHCVVLFFFIGVFILLQSESFSIVQFLFIRNLHIFLFIPNLQKRKFLSYQIIFIRIYLNARLYL